MATTPFYPPVGFLFKVSFPDDENDSDFQEVTGLSVSLETLSVNEGGQNLFSHQLPLRLKPERLVLKRGLKVSSGLQQWCREALEDFSFSPRNLHIHLYDPSTHESMGNPLVSWYIVHAIPVKWSVSTFNAMNSELAIETIELNYNFFTKSFPV